MRSVATAGPFAEVSPQKDTVILTLIARAH
jgi:hypothetical protein